MISIWITQGPTTALGHAVGRALRPALGCALGPALGRALGHALDIAYIRPHVRPKWGGSEEGGRSPPSLSGGVRGRIPPSFN